MLSDFLLGRPKTLWLAKIKLKNRTIQQNQREKINVSTWHFAPRLVIMDKDWGYTANQKLSFVGIFCCKKMFGCRLKVTFTTSILSATFTNLVFVLDGG